MFLPYVHVDLMSVTKVIDAIINFLNAKTVSTQAATTYTFALTDAATVVNNSNASAVTDTVPTNASVAFPVGTEIIVLSTGAGGVTVSPAGGVTLNGTATVAQYTRKTLIKLATNTWVIA